MPRLPLAGTGSGGYLRRCEQVRLRTRGLWGWLLPKPPIYAGTGFTFWFQFGFTALGANVDTLQPANVMNLADKPRAEFMVNSFNINFGGGQCFFGCSGLVVWAISNQFGLLSGGPPPEFTGVIVPTTTYLESLGVHEVSCDFCIEAIDTRLTGSVVYSAGSLWASLDTGCIRFCGAFREATTVIWWELGQLTLNDGDPGCGAFQFQCAQITGASVLNEDCYFCGGRGNFGSNYFGTLQPDPERNVTMVFNYSDKDLNPGTAYVSRRITQAQNTMHDGGIFLQAGIGNYPFFRWGDYTGTAPDLTEPTTPRMWFSGMFSRADGAWGTVIGRNEFTAVDQP